MKTISIYRGESVEIEASITGFEDTVGVEGRFIIKKKFSDSSALIDETSSTWDGFDTVFALSSTDTDITKGLYIFEFTVTLNGYRYVIDQGRVRINETATW